MKKKFNWNWPRRMIAHVSFWQLNNGQVFLDLCLSILISMSCLSHTLMEEFLDLLTNLIMITEWFKAVSSGQTKQSLWLINYASIAWVTNGCICSQENRKSCLELVLNTESWAFSIFSIVAIKQQFILFQVIRGDDPLVMMSGDDVCQVLLILIILILFSLGVINSFV